MIDHRFDYKLRAAKEPVDPETNQPITLPYSSRLAHQDYALAKGIHDNLKRIADSLEELVIQGQAGSGCTGPR